MLLLITVMCVIAEKKLQVNSASLYVVVIFIIGGILIGGGPGPLGPSLATPMCQSAVFNSSKEKKAIGHRYIGTL